MGKAEQGMVLIEKYRKDSGRLFNEYCNFHKDIQFKCQAKTASARLKYGMENEEYRKIADIALNEYQKKKEPKWNEYKEEEKKIYETYIKEMQKLGYYKTDD